MDNQRTYLKIKELDGKQITIDEAYGYKWKKYVENNGKWQVLESEKWEDGFKKEWSVKTTDGYLNLTNNQLQNMVMATYKNGIANIVGVTFNVVKKVGQNGIPNYYFNVVRQNDAVRDSAPQPTNTPDPAEPINYSDIPFN